MRPSVPRRTDETEQVHRRADPGDRQGRRGRSERRGSVPHARDHRADALPLEGEDGGMELSEMQRLKQVEDENRRLKQIVAEQTLDIQALKAVVAKKW